MTRILVLDRDRSTAEGIAAALSAAEDIVAGHAAVPMEEVLHILGKPGVEVDVVVASARNPNGRVLELARSFRSEEGYPRLVATGLTSNDAVILNYLEAGVDAYLTEELSISGLLLVLRLLEAEEVLVSPRMGNRLIQRLQLLNRMLDGTGFDLSSLSKLTPREKEILELLGQQLSNKDISRRLFIGVGTVKTHVHAILRKLGVKGREDARDLLILARSGSREVTGPSSRGGG